MASGVAFLGTKTLPALEWMATDPPGQPPLGLRALCQLASICQLAKTAHPKQRHPQVAVSQLYLKRSTAAAAGAGTGIAHAPAPASQLIPCTPSQLDLTRGIAAPAAADSGAPLIARVEQLTAKRSKRRMGRNPVTRTAANAVRRLAHAVLAAQRPGVPIAKAAAHARPHHRPHWR